MTYGFVEISLIDHHIHHENQTNPGSDFLSLRAFQRPAFFAGLSAV